MLNKEENLEKESKTTPLNVESKAVQTHLGFLQDIISRLSDKSSTCKNWCITLTSAFILLSLRLENGSKYILLSYIPTLLFALLNTYYVYLEKSIRNQYNTFVSKLHNNQLTTSDIYTIKVNFEEKCNCKQWKLSIKSFSILIFYLPLWIINVVITLFIFCGDKV
ncbi:hypothetical protein HF524_00025 [Proteus mirabilis]|uniref:hypothetical protein n=1 Tax=Proteus TaxID=583 RepID=UPI00038102E4|nr:MULTISPECIES: hypothetical protein [Proteus]MBA7797990.1 hypothetical protein [Citrobacter sp. RHBSTW-01065]ALE20775.1 hypothetical protein AOC00_00025 [Proteus mirabilis]ALE23901.1 hypothetical protein AOB99_00025 [Proteus mirabilis]AND14846.1 hypothetical protein AOUC001_18975 [Proteus mirabilis]EKU6774015.1 hypothetical protein [Proteus mirabilis]